jgi:hypothetical protein
MQTIFDGGYRKAIPHVTEWFERMVSLPSFVKSCGYIKLSQKAFKQWDPKAKVEPIKADAPKGGKGGDNKKGKKKEEPKKKEEDDDDFDLFGDDDEDDGAAKKAAEKAKEEAAKKKKKKVVIAMSLVLLEVKPLDDTTDLDKLA